ncbi:MAG: DUF4256 domain-containing protein [Candidatus Heimdallarchaeota archaeon]|nr:DUF4256 domain-containing protein [Candidatus Heimdallarchaeota archaeon]
MIEISDKQKHDLLNVLKNRFERNIGRHKGLMWADIEKRIQSKEIIQSLYAMEMTGGEPDVIGEENGKFIFCDCSAESPVGRRTICYDGAGQAEREKKGIFPAGNAIDLAYEMGVELLNEAHYKDLQKLGKFDQKTSSWIQTPAEIRKLGGALFSDRRYNHVFTYHNGAQSFYSARGFRGLLRV